MLNRRISFFKAKLGFLLIPPETLGRVGDAPRPFLFYTASYLLNFSIYRYFRYSLPNPSYICEDEFTLFVLSLAPVLFELMSIFEFENDYLRGEKALGY